MKPLIYKIPKIIEAVKKIMQESLQGNEIAKEIPLDTEIADWKNIAAFEELRKLSYLNLKAYDLSTEAAGTFFIKNLLRFFVTCKDYMKPTMVMELLNDIFTLPEQNLSLTDIALIYTANDFRVIEANNYLESSKQFKNQSLRDCLQDFQTNAVISKKTEDVEISDKEYKHGYSYKALEPSPCLNLKKFPKCSHYCTLHKHFFEETPLREFTTLMRYAMPQRKIR